MAKKKRDFTLLYIAVLLAITFCGGLYVGKITGTQTTVIGNSHDEYATMSAVINVLTKDFYYGENTDEYRQKLIQQAIEGMVNAQGDPHTVYWTPEEMQEFTSSLETSFVGIGVRYVTLYGNIFVQGVITGSPAEAAGIKVGDLITTVDNLICAESDTDDIVAAIAGEPGTDVRLRLIRDGEEIAITATRAAIDSSIDSRIVDGVGLVTITTFGTETADELKVHLDRIVKKGIKRVVLDLRDNGGGYANTLDAMCRYFMNNNQVIMYEEYRDGTQITDKVSKSSNYNFDRIVILINENSASCSEVFTLALSENSGAITVGTTSYGKGVAQLTKVFSDGSAIKYTDVIWKSSKGVSVTGTGITPDYVCELHPALNEAYRELEDDEVYSFDCVDENVRKAQLMLAFLGYDCGRTDGYFSQQTVETFRKYQQDSGLEITGTYNKQTYQSLYIDVVKAFRGNPDKYDNQLLKALEIAKG